jgi:hypothetical protein
VRQWAQQSTDYVIAGVLFHCIPVIMKTFVISGGQRQIPVLVSKVLCLDKRQESFVLVQNFRVLTLVKTTSYRVKALKKFNTCRVQLSTIPAFPDRYATLVLGSGHGQITNKQQAGWIINELFPDGWHRIYWPFSR